MFKILIFILGLLFSTISKADWVFNFPNPTTTNNSVECNKDNICQLYLDTAIGVPKEYLSLVKKIKGLTSKNTLNIHLVGNGGAGSGLVYLLNAIKYSKVHTIGHMEGSVASAHTILLLACDEVKVEGEGYVLIHSISSSNMIEDICSNMAGKDRGLAVYTKCIENETTIQKFYFKTIDKYNLKYLTKEEAKKYYEGHDIIIDSEELQRRLK